MMAGDFVVTVDEPETVAGMFLVSVASCFALAVVHIARKRSIVLHALSVAVTGTYQGPRFRLINIDGRFGCDPTEVALLTRAAERACHVTNTLPSNIEVIVEAIAMGAKTS